MIFLNTTAQKQAQIIPKPASYEIDETKKIIVWHYTIPHVSSSENSKKIKVTFKNSIDWKTSIDSLSYEKKYKIKYQDKGYTLYITSLPLIKISVTDSIKDEPKIASTFYYANQDTIFKATAGIEWRGNISLKFPKKTYDLEFWSDSETKKSRDVRFDPLRKDDDWILDGLYNEPLRLRSYISNKLWLELRKSTKENTKQQAGIDLLFTEVFLNGSYIGLYCLTEQVDRKLLNLKEYADGKVHGELFKAGSYQGAPSFVKAPEYKNLFPHWAGYEMVYPVIDYKSYWNNVYDLTTFVISSEKEEFKASIWSRMDKQNVMDYFIFVNLIRATDNLGKNFYLARRDSSSLYYFVPWDLDGVLGTIQDGKRIPTTDDILSNGLFDRLLKDNPQEFKKDLKNRWKYLRESIFKTSHLENRIASLHQKLKNENIYERELATWPSDKSLEDHYEYMDNWLKKRLIYLDSYFSSLE